MGFGKLFFINTGPIRTLANLSNVVILKQPKTVKDTTGVMDTFHRLQLKPREFWKMKTFYPICGFLTDSRPEGL
jgi:hypothetical protein